MNNKIKQISLALDIIQWLESNDCTVSAHKVGDEFHIVYTLKDDMTPQPDVRITAIPSVIFPKGSEVSVVNAFMMRGLYKDRSDA